MLNCIQIQVIEFSTACSLGSGRSQKLAGVMLQKIQDQVYISCFLENNSTLLRRLWVDFLKSGGRSVIEKKPCQSLFLHPASATGVTNSLARSVCECVCVLLSRVNGQTYGPEFWYGGQVEGYLGQVRRSQVKGQGHQVKKRVFQ